MAPHFCFYCNPGINFSTNFKNNKFVNNLLKTFIKSNSFFTSTSKALFYDFILAFFLILSFAFASNNQIDRYINKNL